MCHSHFFEFRTIYATFWIFVHFRTANGNLELDFESDPADIRNPDTHVKDYSTIHRMQSESKPKYRVSLRVCISLCYVLFYCQYRYTVNPNVHQEIA